MTADHPDHCDIKREMDLLREQLRFAEYQLKEEREAHNYSMVLLERDALKEQLKLAEHQVKYVERQLKEEREAHDYTQILLAEARALLAKKEKDTSCSNN